MERCNFFQKTIARKFALRRHLNTHRGDPSLKCDICDVQFADAHDLTTHRTTKHLMHAFECAICPKKFTSRSGLHVHMKIHSGLVHKCTSCNAAFATRSRLHRNAISHTYSHAFTCEGCGSKFKYKRSLTRHSFYDKLAPFAYCAAKN